MRRCDDPSNAGTIMVTPILSDCIIATRGYGFREGQPSRCVRIALICSVLRFSDDASRRSSPDLETTHYVLSGVIQAVGADDLYFRRMATGRVRRSMRDVT